MKDKCGDSVEVATADLKSNEVNVYDLVNAVMDISLEMGGKETSIQSTS